MQENLENQNNRKDFIKDAQQIQFGIMMMIIASLFFSLTAILIKSLNHLPLMELIFFRNLPSFLIIPFIIRLNHLPIFGENKLLLFLRSIFGFITMIGFVYTFMKMNVTDAMAIRQLSPFAIIILSKIFLLEKFNTNQLLIFNLAFIGALLVIKPGFRYEMFPVIVGLLSTFSSASGHTILRQLRLSDHPLVIVNFFAFFSIIVSIIILTIQNNFLMPNAMEILLLLSLGLASFLAQITLSYAYRFAPANVVSLYLYSRVLITSILDFIIFREITDYLSIIGCILIAMGGYLYFQNRVRM